MSCCGGADKNCVNTSCINVRNGNNILKGQIIEQPFNFKGKKFVQIMIFNKNNEYKYLITVNINKIKKRVLNFSNLSNNNILNLEKIGHEELEKSRLIDNAFRKGAEFTNEETRELENELSRLDKNAKLNENIVNSTDKINRKPTSRDGGGASTSSNRRVSTSSNRRVSISSNRKASTSRDGGGASTSRDGGGASTSNNKSVIKNNLIDIKKSKNAFQKFFGLTQNPILSPNNLKVLIQELIKINNQCRIYLENLLKKNNLPSKILISIQILYDKLGKLNLKLNKKLLMISNLRLNTQTKAIHETYGDLVLDINRLIELITKYS